MKRSFIGLLVFSAFFPGLIFASSANITQCLLNGSSGKVTFDAANGKTSPLKISLVTDRPVKYSTLAICLVSDAVCSRTTAVKYFTSSDLATTLAKEWDGKTGGSNPAVVSDGDYRLKATMKDDSGADTTQDLSAQVISVLSGAVVPDTSDGTEASSSPVDQTASTTNDQDDTSGAVIYSGGGSSSSHSEQEELTEAKDEPAQIGAGRARLGIVGSPLDFRAERGTSFVYFNFNWSFGDGGEAVGEKVSHTFLFAGDYQVVLHGFYDGKEAISRTTVKIIDPQLSITDVNWPAGYFEIANDSSEEINLYGWSLICDKIAFPFPRDTIMTGRSKLKIPLYLTKCLSNTASWGLSDITGRSLVKYFGTLAKLEPNIVGEATTSRDKRERISQAIAMAWKTADFGSKRRTSDPPVIASSSSSSSEQKPVLQTGQVIVLGGEPGERISWWKKIGSWFGL